MPAIEMKSVVSPSTNFDVRIDKKINIEEEEENSVIASDMKNTLNQILFKRIGVPVSWLLPSGTVKAPQL